MPSILWTLMLALAQVASTSPGRIAELFERGRTIDLFVESVVAQRQAWLKNMSDADPGTQLVDRLRRVKRGLRILVVAEDWCLDSANTVPYLAALTARAAVPLRIVDRVDGEWLMRRHPAPDGRRVTPTVILLRDGIDVGAWIERPAPLQKLFLSMLADPESAKQFAQRQTWYDADRGRTTLSELVALAEQTAPAK